MSEGMMSRRAFCRSAAGGAVGLALRGALGGTTRPAERPNILMVVTDDLGCQVGCYGDPIARTPNIDGLAAEGVRFTRAYVTQASCSPSRSSMFTGMYPHQNGQIGLAHRGYSMRPGLKTLPALLKAAGYRTGVLGKVHVKPGRDLPFDFHQFNATGTRDVARTAKVADGFMHGGRGKPFFLMVNLFDPHRPFENTFRGLPKQPLGPDDVKPPPFLGVDAPEVRKEVAGYYNCAARADAGLGMLLRALARNGCEKNTIVMFLGDHGPPFPRAKLSCYEAGIRIPLVIRWPGRIEAGLVSDALVSTIDFLPTLNSGRRPDAGGAARPVARAAVRRRQGAVAGTALRRVQQPHPYGIELLPASVRPGRPLQADREPLARSSQPFGGHIPSARLGPGSASDRQAGATLSPSLADVRASTDGRALRPEGRSVRDEQLGRQARARRHGQAFGRQADRLAETDGRSPR